MLLGHRSGILIKIDNVSKALVPTRFFFWHENGDGIDLFVEVEHSEHLISPKFEESPVFITGGCLRERHASSFMCRLMQRKEMATVEQKGKEKLDVQYEGYTEDTGTEVEEDTSACGLGLGFGRDRQQPRGKMARRGGLTLGKSRYWQAKDE